MGKRWNCLRGDPQGATSALERYRTPNARLVIPAYAEGRNDQLLYMGTQGTYCITCDRDVLSAHPKETLRVISVKLISPLSRRYMTLCAHNPFPFERVIAFLDDLDVEA
jgi:hypothetical protein